MAESKKQRLASSGPETMQRDILTELATPHLASPDVHVDTVDETIVMHFHGLDGLGRQVTRVANFSEWDTFHGAAGYFQQKLSESVHK